MVSFCEVKCVVVNGMNGMVMVMGMMNEDDGVWDVVIVGVGVVGVSLVYSFGGEGRRVLCVERDLSTSD